MGLVVMLSLLLGGPVPVPADPGGCQCGPSQVPTPVPDWDDDDWDDDDWIDDDDTSVDDDTGDDDGGPPPYTGEIDLESAAVYASCTVTEPDLPEVLEDGAGWFEFSIDLSGWAETVWIELRDQQSDYCEGFDPATGDPCTWAGFTRPGWDMDNIDFGWNTELGFWDYWELTLPYDGDLAHADADGASWFLCEEAGISFDTWFCATDLYSDLTYCTLFPLEAW